MLLIVFFAYWVPHLKERFADARASLVPGFRWVHGMVAIVMAAVFSILLPGVTAPLIGWQCLGFFSITILIFGLILWITLHPGPTFVLIVGVGWLSTFLPTIQRGIEQIAWGYKPAHAFILMAIGAVLSITGMIRLFQLNEDMPEYHLNIVFPKNGRSQFSDLQWRKIEKSYSRGWRNWYANRPIVTMIHHARNAADSNWSKMRRWHFKTITVWSAFILALVFNLAIKLVVYFTDSNFSATFSVFMPTLISAIITVMIPAAKNRHFSYDIMMPVRREIYLKQLGGYLAIRHVTIWGVMMAVSIFWMLIAAVKPSPGFLAYGIIYSIAIQIWMFGVTVWIFSFRKIIMTILIMYIAILPTATLILTFDAQIMIQRRPLITLFVCCLAAIGLLLTWRGYRRWLVADLD